MLGRGTLAEAGRSTWTSTSGWTVGRAWGSECGGLWLKQEVQHPVSTRVCMLRFPHQNADVEITQQRCK